MVSRRKILSRSRDDLTLDQSQPPEEEEDVWYQKDKLLKEHIQEVLDKWNQIDDEIWAKVIVFERNRRVAKAYARAPVLTINGSDEGFDGMRIGLCGFDNPMRDQKTEEARRHVGQGVKIKMDDNGNILVRRYSKSNVYAKSTATNPNDESAIGPDVLKSSNRSLESEKIMKLFDMKRFQSNINRELRQAYPDRKRLELQCMSALSFHKTDTDLLDCPIWVLVINVVAMDMLKSKLPPMARPVTVKSRPKLPIPDEDPYSIALTSSGDNSDSSGYGQNGHPSAGRDHQHAPLAQRRNEKPPQLPPRDNLYSQDLPTPDYEAEESENKLKTFFRKPAKEKKDKKKYEDPYYCGLSARVPKFTKSKKPNKNESVAVPKRMSVAYLQHPSPYITGGYQYQSQQQLMAAAQHQQHHHAPPHPHYQQMMWHARSMESGLGSFY